MKIGDLVKMRNLDAKTTALVLTMGAPRGADTVVRVKYLHTQKVVWVIQELLEVINENR